MELLKPFKKETISFEDLSFLNELLKTGASLSNCFELLKNQKNEKVFDKIIDRLIEGVSIENAIACFIPKEIETYLLPLLKTLPFNNALDLSLSFYKESKENEKTIISSIAYPFILLFVSITALYLFDLYGLDSIFSLLESFNTNLTFYKVSRIIIRIVIYCFYFGLLILTALVIYFSNEKRIIIFYKWIAKCFPNSLVKSYFCEEFISLLLICQKLGYKTKDSLSYIKSLIKKPIISVLAYQMDESLLNGSSLNEASSSMWFDSLLNGYIKIASHTKSFESILENYILINKLKIKKRMKNLASGIQILIYLLIGLIIIFVYQILFLPMQAMTNF